MVAAVGFGVFVVEVHGPANLVPVVIAVACTVDDDAIVKYLAVVGGVVLADGVGFCQRHHIAKVHL